METKFVKVPFDIELAKEITNGTKEGRIVTRDGRSARVVCWDRKGLGLPIIALVDNGDEGECYYSFMVDGKWNDDKIYDLDLMIEIPEYMAFKDGDILISDCGAFIYNGNYEFYIESVHYGAYCGINSLGGLNIIGDKILEEKNSSWTSFKGIRFSTEPEKQKLIDALKSSKDPKAKEYLKRFFGIEVKTECEFKPKDWVLGRDDDEEWGLDIFSHTKINGEFACVGAIWKQIIPYNEKTAHLLGTTEDYKGD